MVREHGEHRRPKTNKHVGAQSCRLVSQLPFQPNRATQNGRNHKSCDGSRQYRPHVTAQKVETVASVHVDQESV